MRTPACSCMKSRLQWMVFLMKKRKRSCRKNSWERQHFWSALHIDDRPCGGCALYEFEAMGIAGVKIVGRDNALEKKIKDVKFMRGSCSPFCASSSRIKRRSVNIPGSLPGTI